MKDSKLAAVSSNNPLITSKEARKLLGKRSKRLTNEELKVLIDDTETLVRVAVRGFIGSKKLNNNDNMEMQS